MLARGALVASKEPRVDARLVISVHARQQTHEFVSLKLANANQTLAAVLIRGRSMPIGKFKHRKRGNLVRLQAAGVCL